MHVLRSSATVAFTIVIALSASPRVLHAQFPSIVETGTRVRAWIPEERRQQDGPTRRLVMRGTVESIAGDTLRISIPGTAGILAVPRTSLRRLDVSRGEPSRVASGLERAVSGAIGGAVTMAIANDPDRSSGPSYRTDWQAAGVGAAWGAGIGAAIGLVFPHERWRRVRLSR